MHIYGKLAIFSIHSKKKIKIQVYLTIIFDIKTVKLFNINCNFYIFFILYPNQARYDSNKASVILCINNCHR